MYEHVILHKIKKMTLPFEKKSLILQLKNKSIRLGIKVNFNFKVLLLKPDIFDIADFLFSKTLNIVT